MCDQGILGKPDLVIIAFSINDSAGVSVAYNEQIGNYWGWNWRCHINTIREKDEPVTVSALKPSRSPNRLFLMPVKKSWRSRPRRPWSDTSRTWFTRPGHPRIITKTWIAGLTSAPAHGLHSRSINAAGRSRGLTRKITWTPKIFARWPPMSSGID